MAIHANDLGCKRGGRLVLAGLTLDLGPGDCLLLKGPNGSGKTTLLRTLAGLSEPASGTLQIDPDAIAHAGHLDAVKAQLSVAENLQFWSDVYGGPSIQQTLERFHLTDLAGRAAAHLSAGQKRRLGLARLALTRRPIWLLDEPTTSLDATHVKLVEQTLTDHCAQGGTAVVATHLALTLPGAQTLNVGDFAATQGPANTPEADPFLQGVM